MRYKILENSIFRKPNILPVQKSVILMKGLDSRYLTYFVGVSRLLMNTLVN